MKLHFLLQLVDKTALSNQWIRNAEEIFKILGNFCWMIFIKFKLAIILKTFDCIWALIVNKNILKITT